MNYNGKSIIQYMHLQLLWIINMQQPAKLVSVPHMTLRWDTTDAEIKAPPWWEPRANQTFPVSNSKPEVGQNVALMLRLLTGLMPT